MFIITLTGIKIKQIKKFAPSFLNIFTIFAQDMIALMNIQRKGIISMQTLTKEAEMLESLYKNVKMGSDSIIKLMDKVSGSDFKAALTKQIDGYEKVAERIRKHLTSMGYTAKEENVMVKLWSSVGMAMNTMMDSTDSHLAQLVAEGSNMGITDSIKLLRDYENTSVSEEALGFAREVIKLEEHNLEVAKSFI